MQLVIWTALFIIGYASAGPVANNYIETVLNTTLRNEIRGLQLDPAALPDYETEFEDKVRLIGKVKGKAEFFEGNLTGLSEAARHSECEGPYYFYGIKSINCTIGFEKLKIKYYGKMKYGKMPRVSIKGKAKIKDTLLFVEVIQNPPLQPMLRNFLFRQFGDLEIKFEGLGPLNRFTEALEDGFKGHVQAQIFNSMSQRFHNALSRAVAVVPVPL